MINTERVKLVVDALRGDEYKQGAHALVSVTEDGLEYCCLGVMCDIAIKNGLEGLEAVNDGYRIGYVTKGGHNREYNLLPLEVMQWYGFDSVGPSVGIPSGHGFYQEELAVLNDGGCPFSRIADLIESNYVAVEQS